MYMSGILKCLVFSQILIHHFLPVIEWKTDPEDVAIHEISI